MCATTPTSRSSDPPPVPRRRYDAVVVGGRAAGAATAMLLARAGASVLVLERSAPDADTLSTHALLRGAVIQLHRWGVLAEVLAHTPSYDRTTFVYGDDAVVVPIRTDDGLPGLCAPRRTVLDPILAGAARRAGAEVHHGVTVTSVCTDASGRATGVEIRDRDGAGVAIGADLVIGADGADSLVARAVRAPLVREGRHASGITYAYCAHYETSGNEWHYRPGASAGVIPTGDGLTCVFGATNADSYQRRFRRGGQARFLELLATASPDVADRAADGGFVGPLRTFAGRRGHVRGATGPGWALVGDAGCFRDPVTAHGLTDALRDAELLARAVVDGDLAGYGAARDGLGVEVFDLSDAIAAFDWDLTELSVLLRRLSEAMRPEVELLGALDAAALAV